MIYFTLIFSKFCKKFISSHKRYFVKKAVLKNFVIFTGKHLCQNLFIIKLRGWKVKQFY